MDISNIPEFTKREVEILKKAGISTINDLVGMSAELLSQLTGYSIEKCNEIIRKSWKYYSPKIVDASSISESEKVIETPLPTLNKLFGGGIQVGTITQLYGSFGSGKSSFLFTQSVLEASKGNIVVFIDTERTFSRKRVEEIARNRGIDVSKLKNIKVITATSSNEVILLVARMARLIDQLERDGKVSMIILDSLTAPFRSDYIGLDELVERQQKLNWVLRTLLRVAQIKELAIMFSNQVVASVGSFEKFSPVGGHVVAHISTHVFKLLRGKNRTRVLRLYDVPFLPEKDIIFRITSKGVEEVVKDKI